MKISINDKEYGLHWGFGAIRLFCDKMECEYEPAMDMILGGGDYTILQRTKALSTMILCAIENYANIHNTDADVTFQQVEAFRDDTPKAEFQKVLDNFMDANIMGSTYRAYLGISTEPATTASKKKSPSQKSASSSTK